MGKKKNPIDFTDGNWHATTIGQFVGLLVDSNDVAVIYRVSHDTPKDENGLFVRHMEIMLVPQGRVMETWEKMFDNPDVELVSTHKYLAEFVRGGLLK
jgi:hypothetical protein